MQTIQLPFITSSVSTTTRSGKHKFGWSFTQVEVIEKDKKDFPLAVCHVYDDTHSESIYAHDNAFWTSALYSARPVLFNARGLEIEATFSSDGEHDFAWLRQLSGCLNWKMKQRAKANETIFSADARGFPKTGTILPSRDGHEEDREIFIEWCRENLRFVDGRLLVRVHEPSILISWSHEPDTLKDSIYPFRKNPLTSYYKASNLEPGIHFALDDSDCEETWQRITDHFEYGRAMVQGHSNKNAINDAALLLQTMGQSDKFIIRDMMIFDAEIIESMGRTYRENMTERSAITVAKTIYKASRSRHDEIVALKNMLTMPNFEFQTEHLETLEKSLTALPCDDMAARKWFIDEILERLTERIIPVPRQRGSMP